MRQAFLGAAVLLAASVPTGAQRLPHGIPPCATTVVDVTAMDGQVFDCLTFSGTFEVPAGVTIHATTILGLAGSSYVQRGEVVIRDVPPDDRDQFHTGLLLLGSVDIQGEPVPETFVRAPGELAAGQTLESIAKSAGWSPTDTLLVPDSSVQRPWQRIESLSPTEPLRHDHPGARNKDGSLVFTPHVANLTRTCRIRSESPTGTRGHVLISSIEPVRVAFCAFEDLGRTTTEATSDHGNPNNQVGRYPLHLHHHRGPLDLPEGTPQFEITGNVISNTTRVNGRFKPKNGIVVHDTHFGLVRDNVLHRLDGAAIYLEAGNETENLIAHNLCVDVQGVGDRLPGDMRDANGNRTHSPEAGGNCVYSRGTNSRIVDNVAANITNAQLEGAFGFKYFPRQMGEVRLPKFPGADTSKGSQVRTESAYRVPVLEWDGNECYATDQCTTYWWLGSEWRTPRAREESVLRNGKAWNIWNMAIYHYEAARLTIDGWTILHGSPERWTTAIRMQDYMAADVTLRNLDIQNTWSAIQISTDVEGTLRIEDSRIHSKGPGILREQLWSVNGRVGPREVVVENVTFDTAGAHIAERGPSQGTLSPNAEDIIHVLDLNGDPDDDFVLFRSDGVGGDPPCRMRRAKFQGFACQAGRRLP